MDRRAILQRLQKLLLKQPAESPCMPEKMPHFPRYADKIAKFRKELQGVGGSCLDGSDESALSKSLEQILRETKTRELWWENLLVLENNGVPYELTETTDVRIGEPFLYVSFHENSKVVLPLELSCRKVDAVSLAEVTVSVGAAEKAVAETGTVVESSGQGKSRLTQILSPVHVVLLSKKSIVDSQVELFSGMDIRAGGSATMLTSGPSRTADIEKTLTIGVHGPKQLYVILTA